jgi:hypothetical protein
MALNELNGYVRTNQDLQEEKEGGRRLWKIEVDPDCETAGAAFLRCSRLLSPLRRWLLYLQNRSVYDILSVLID